MKSLDSITVTKEQAERLEKAGWTKETVFGWRNSGVWRLVDSALAGCDLHAPTMQELVEVTGCKTMHSFGSTFHASIGIRDTYRWGQSSVSMMESLIRLFEAQNKIAGKP